MHIQQFGRILDWFGPVSKNVTLPPPRYDAFVAARYTNPLATPPPLILVSCFVVRPSTCDEALVSPRKQALMRKGKGGGAACTKEKSATGHGSHKDGRRAGSGKRRAATRRKRAGRGHYASESDDDSGECDTDTARTDVLTDVVSCRYLTHPFHFFGSHATYRIVVGRRGGRRDGLL